MRMLPALGLLGLLGAAFSQATYETKTYGSCQFPITSLAECGLAAEELGYYFNGSTGSYGGGADDMHGVSWDPPGCYFENGYLQWNSGSYGVNTGSCSSRDVCFCRDRAATTDPVSPGIQPSVFVITSGRTYCEIDSAGCLTDGVDNYGNNEHCDVHVARSGTISFDGFATEGTYDTLTVAGHVYSGSTSAGLSAEVVAGETISWRSDASYVGAGWRLCFTEPTTIRPDDGDGDDDDDGDSVFWITLTLCCFCCCFGPGYQMVIKRRQRESAAMAALPPIEGPGAPAPTGGPPDIYATPINQQAAAYPPPQPSLHPPVNSGNPQHGLPARGSGFGAELPAAPPPAYATVATPTAPPLASASSASPSAGPPPPSYASHVLRQESEL